MFTCPLEQQERERSALARIHPEAFNALVGGSKTSAKCRKKIRRLGPSDWQDQQIFPPPESVITAEESIPSGGAK